MARYGEAFRNRVVARLLPPESANVGVVANEIGVSVQTLERWREQAQSRPSRERAWTAGGRLEAVIAAAALDEAGKSVWCREHGVYPADLDKWRLSATTALAEPGEHWLTQRCANQLACKFPSTAQSNCGQSVVPKQQPLARRGC